jgi:hypothetical protein
MLVAIELVSIIVRRLGVSDLVDMILRQLESFS